MTNQALTAPGERPATNAELFANRDFRRLWVAISAASLGDSIAQVALPLLVYALTGSEALVGLVFAIAVLPDVVLAPISGILADRLDRRRIILSADLGRMIAVCFLPFAGAVWQIVTIAVVVSSFTALSRPAELAAVPMVAGERLNLRAVSLTMVSGAAIRVIGPTIGGVLVATAGPGPTFFAQALCFVVSAVMIYGLRLPERRPELTESTTSATGRASAITFGLRVLWRQRAIRAIVGAEMVWAGAGTLLAIGLVAYTQDTLDLGDSAGTIFGLLIAAFSGGAMVGGLLAGRIEARLGRSFMLGFGYFAPLLLIAVFFVPPLPLVFAALFLFGLSDSWLVAATNQLIVERIIDAERGRFYAVWTAIISLAFAAWNGLLGPLTEFAGAPVVFLVVGLVCGLGCPLVLLLTGTIRELLHSERRSAVLDGGDLPATPV